MSEQDLTTSLLPLHFQGHQIRTSVDAQGNVWWVAQDVGMALDLANVHKSLQSFPSDEKGVTNTYTLGGMQAMTVLNEPGLYRLIFQSRKPEAETLKLWVFHEVLPTLRRTGSYTLPQATEVMTPKESVSLPAPPVLTKMVLPGLKRTMPPQQDAKRVEVSMYMAQAWHVLRTAEVWLSNRDLARHAAISERSARAYTYYFFGIGILACQEMFPRHLYRLKRDAMTQHPHIVTHLDTCYEILMQRAEV